MPEAEIESSLLQYSNGLEITKEMMDKLEKNTTPWNTSANLSGVFSMFKTDLTLPEPDQMESSVKLNDILETTKEMMENSEHDILSETPANLSSVIFTPKQKTLEEGELEVSGLQLNNSQRINEKVVENLEQEIIPQNTSLNVSGVLSTSDRKIPTPEAGELESSQLQLDNSRRIEEAMENLGQENILKSTSVNSSIILSTSSIQLNTSQRINQEMTEELQQDTVPQNISVNSSVILPTSGIQLNTSQRINQEVIEELQQEIIPQNTSLNASGVLSTSTRKITTPDVGELEASQLQHNNDGKVNKESDVMEQDVAPQNASINSSIILSTSVNKIPTPELDKMVSSLLESNDQEADQEMTENVEENPISLNTSTNVSGMLSTSTRKIPTPDLDKMESSLLQTNNTQEADQEMTENVEENPLPCNVSVNVSNVLSNSISKVPMQEELETTVSLLQPNNDQGMTENLREDDIPQSTSVNMSGILSTSARNALMPEAEMESLLQFSNGLEMTKDMMENLEKNSALWNTSGDVSGGFLSLKSDMPTGESNTESSFLKMNSAPEMNERIFESEQDIMSVKTPVDFSCMIPTPTQNLPEENDPESSILHLNNSQRINQETMDNLMQDSIPQNTSANFEMFSSSGFKAPMSETELENSLSQLNHGLEISKRMAEILGKGVSALNMSTTLSQTLGNQSNIFMTEKDEMNFLLLEARCAHEASKELCEKLKYELTNMKNEYNEMKDLSEKLQVENLEAKKEIAVLNATILEGKKKYNEMRSEFSEKEEFLNAEIRQKDEKCAELEVEKESLISKGKKKLEDLRQENDFLSTEIEELKENLKNLETENEKFKEMYCNSERELKETSEKLKLMEPKFEEFEKNIAVIEEEKQKLNEMYCNNEQELNEKLEKLRIAESKIEQLERNVAVFEEEKQKLSEFYGNLENEKATLSEKLENYDILIDELKKTMKLSEEENKRWKDLKNEAEEKLRDSESRIETLQDKIISLEEDNQKLKLENEEKSASNFKVEELENKIASIEEENQKLKLENEEKLRASDSRIEELQNKFVLIEEENKKLSGNEERLRISDSRIEELQTKLTMLEGENQKLQSENEEKLKAFTSRVEELQNKLTLIEDENQKLNENGKEYAEVAAKLKVTELRVASLEKKVKEYENTIDELEETQRMNSDTIFSLTKQNTQLKEKLGISGLRAIIEMDCSSHSVNEDKEQSFTSAKEYPSPKNLDSSTMTDGNDEKENTPNTPSRKPSFASKLTSPFRKNKQPQNPNSTCNQQ